MTLGRPRLVTNATPNRSRRQRQTLPCNAQSVKTPLCRCSDRSEAHARTRQIPIGHLGDINALPTRGFVPWRLSNAGRIQARRHSSAKSRHPKPFTAADIGAAGHILAQVAVWQGRTVYAFTKPSDLSGQSLRAALARSGRRLQRDAKQLDSASRRVAPSFRPGLISDRDNHRAFIDTGRW